ncbi:MAG: PQQ-binding-like beta-propeller repeat protein [Haloglomus sp.]
MAEDGPVRSPVRATPLPDRYLTRRRLLAGASAAGAVGVAELLPIGGIAGWTPAPDTWPLARHDLANTAGTGASLPTDPSVAWRDDGLGRDDVTTVVVGPRRVYAGGDGVVALDRADGQAAWRAPDVASGRLALRDGRLYAGTAAEVLGPDTGVLALDAATGARRWRRPLPATESTVMEVTSLHVADGTVFAGLDGGAAAFDAGRGRRRWLSTGGVHSHTLAVHRSRLYAATFDSRLSRHAPRDLLDVPLGDGPAADWQSDPPVTEVRGPPVPTDRAVFCGQQDDDGAAGLAACRSDSGAVTWTALGHPRAASADAGVLASSLAVGDGVVVSTVEYEGDTRPELVAVDAADGEVCWRITLDTDPRTTAVSDGAALVATGTESPAGTVRAYDLASGAERWQVALSDAVVSLAAVEGTVFAADHAGTVYALRD